MLLLLLPDNELSPTVASSDRHSQHEQPAGNVNSVGGAACLALCQSPALEYDGSMLCSDNPKTANSYFVFIYFGVAKYRPDFTLALPVVIIPNLQVRKLKRSDLSKVTL